MNYKYAGLYLSAEIAAEILMEALHSGAMPKVFTTQQAYQYASAAHTSREGLTHPQTRLSIVREPLEVWVQRGWVVKTAFDQYTWQAGKELCPETEVSLGHAYPELAEVLPTGCVYVFYYEPDVRLAQLQGLRHWPCKIGRTERTSRTRVREQFNTHYHSKPKICIEWPTDNPVALEKAAHALLELRGRRVPESVGTEWFYTNPDEMTELLAQLDTES